MTITVNINQHLVEQWLSANFSDKQVLQQLQQMELDELTYNLYLQEYKRRKLQKRTTLGIGCLVAGGFIGFMSCILSIANPVPELYNTILFGLTSLAIVVIFAGLYFIFE